ncbi:hypothetical protein B0H14DRAFT_2615798 [Mycena olivaceomarginata]|nr:hypothetical protein B0H14DRAFT_2615798 [Mycena olivaceomarginata]
MEKNELVEYEAFMRGQEHAQNERANDNSQYMVGVFLDDTLIAVAKEDQMGVDEITLDSVAERVGMGIRRVCDEPEVPPSRHGRHTRLLAPYARERGPVFCAAVTAEYLKHRTEVSAFTDVRAHVLAFTHRALVLIGRRHWLMETESLHQPCPPPLPFLFAQEYARLRLVLHTFRAHGYHPVANQASDLLHFQFKQPEVILQFLHSGLLDAADTYPEISREDPSEFWVADPAHSNIKTDQARNFFRTGRASYSLGKQAPTISRDNHGHPMRGRPAERRGYMRFSSRALSLVEDAYHGAGDYGSPPGLHRFQSNTQTVQGSGWEGVPSPRPRSLSI